ncbi:MULTISPECIES: hypothetical protein [Wolbachia]|uniref:hypothetical protein n=2 Tax=Wolbachieae TaxID=952 RepID=UPI000BB658E1|nr:MULTISPECIES: hypothetical protein [Wolbachia]MBS9531066.1 hypothetical protein [Wolbachia endosymbiont of Rhagoletis cerasi]PBQ29108.1 hypothetical protein BTO27_01540 [Wolbachia pipientis wAus]UFO00479.1 hypothetical protein LOK48_00560 [Wolbachia endosymbiont of Corcyra cephalonica]UXX40975.1 hypothetical protein MJ631_03290 [Wolbachia endosymbiont of Oryzaephilus surinamensis]
MRDSVLKRYALAYIKENGSDKNVQEFLRSRGMQNIENWSDKNFENAYKEFRRYNPTNEHNIGSDRRDSRQQPTSPQVTHVHVHNNRGLDFWDYLLLSNLFSGHTTVINNLGSGSSNQPCREDKKKDAEDNRKLLALGIVAVVTCVAFHALMCVWYNSSEKTARKSEKVDYLDNKLKMFRNIEFAVGAISLAALVGCAINPVLPVWGLVILGINSLVCFAGGVAFHMKHEKESENIKKAEEAVINYHKSEPGYDLGDSSNLEPPPPYSPQDPNTASSAPSYDGTPGYAFGDPNATQQFGGCAAKP